MKKHKFFAVFTAALLAFTVFGCKQNDDSNPEKCMLTYDANGGTGEMKNVTADEGSEITLTANAFTRMGYTFAKWDTKVDGSGDKYVDEAKFKLTANTTLYAQWTANTYTVEFDKNADDATGDAPAEIQATYDKDFALPENKFTKIGYNFAGWNTKADGSGTDYEANAKVKNLTEENNATVILYAQWTERGTHKIVYNLNGGNHSGTPTTSFKETDEITLGTAEKIGYTFGGWYEAEYFSGTAIADWKAGEKTEDVTLYAQWTANTYTVTFDKNADDATGDAPANIPATYDVEFELPENTFAKIGYNFAGWNTEKNGSGTDYEAKLNVKNLTAENGATVTLYAKWKAIDYSITYELDGGTNADGNPASYTIEDSITLKNPTKDGYLFGGWYETEDFSGTAVTNWKAGEKTEDVTLYAKWDFVKVPAISINGSENWTPASNVFVSGRKLEIKAFLMSDHQVTRGEYKEIMKSDPSYAKAYDKDGNELTGDAADNNPVNNVNWYDAIVYCNKRSIKEGLTPCYTINSSTDPNSWGEVPTSSNDAWNAATCDFEVNGYRLPTEAEWEWAARGGENYTYAGSDDINEVAWYKENTNSKGTREVKTKKANGYGLYDMNGNVYEWCWDWDSNISSSTPAAGASSGSLRCLRGGSWLSNNSRKVANRDYSNPEKQYQANGLRVVRTAE